MSLRLDENLAGLLSQIRSLLPSEKVYLVGGAVRDLLLGKPVHDLDFVLAKDSVRLAKAVKNRFQGVWFTLDDERQTARVILRQGSDQELVFDFTSFIGDTVEEDLSQRDFTINAMAIDLDEPEVLIDPLGGRSDLIGNKLKPGSPRSLIDDPLRVLRGVRMVRMYGLVPSPEIIAIMRVATKGLRRVSGERIRDELLKVLACSGREETFDLLNRYGIYDLLAGWANALISEIELTRSLSDGQSKLMELDIEENKDRAVYSDFYAERAEIIKNLDITLSAIQNNDLPEQFSGIEPFVQDMDRFLQQLKETLNEELQGARTRLEAILLTAFLAGSFDDPGFAENLTNFLMLGQKEKKAIEKICLGHRNISTLSSKNELNALESYRLFRESGTFTVESALLHLCEEETQNVNQRKVAIKVLASWFVDQESVIDPPRLIDGDQLQKELGVSPGPWMGEYLEAIREAQVTGEVNSYQDAIDFVRRMIENRSKDESKG